MSSADTETLEAKLSKPPTRQKPNDRLLNTSDSVLHQIADDLDLLARLHDQELDADIISALQSEVPENWFSLPPTDEPAIAGFALLGEAFSQPVTGSLQAQLDELAADYAALYLTHSHRASPNESVWMTEDGLVKQEPMFEIRQWYQRYNLAVPDWRIRSDDHLVNQVVFVAKLMRLETPEALRDAGQFLDQHLLNWIKDFTDSAVSRCDTAFYAGLVLLTQSYMFYLRKLLVELTGEPRKVPRVVVPIQMVDEPPGEAYIPGTQPGW